jgi:hypothetical protein
MANPRSWNRREFNVAPTGWFTVLKPTGWFSTAAHLPTGFRYPAGSSKRNVAPATSALESGALGLNAKQGTILPPQILAPATHDGVVRLLLVVLGACATAWLLLWWLIESQRF